jgi:hypothetical protein
MTAKSLIEQVAEERATERKENEAREVLTRKKALWHSQGFITFRLEGLEKKELAVMQKEYDVFERDLIELNMQKARLGELKRDGLESDFRGIEFNLSNPDKIPDIKRDITNLKKKLEKLDEKKKEEQRLTDEKKREEARNHELRLKEEQNRIAEKMRADAMTHELRVKEEQRLLVENQAKIEQERRLRAEHEAKKKEEEAKKAQLAIQMKQEKRKQKELELKEKKIKLMEMRAKRKESKRKGANVQLPLSDKKAPAPSAVNPPAEQKENEVTQETQKDTVAEAPPQEPPKAEEAPPKVKDGSKKAKKKQKKAAVELVSPTQSADGTPPEPVMLNLSKKDSNIQVPIPQSIDDWEGLFEYWDSPDAERLVPELEKLGDKDIATIINWINKDEIVRSDCKKLILKWNTNNKYFTMYDQKNNLLNIKRTFIGGLYTLCELLSGKEVLMYLDTIRYWQPLYDLYEKNRPIYDLPIINKVDYEVGGEIVAKYIRA